MASSSIIKCWYHVNHLPAVSFLLLLLLLRSQSNHRKKAFQKNLHHNDNGHNDDDASQKKFLGPQELNLVLLITSICKAEALNCCINYMILPKQLNSFRQKIWWQNLHLISASNSVEYAWKHSQWIFQMIIFSGQSNLQLLELGQRVNRFSLKRSSIVIQLLFESAAVSQ